MTASIAARTAGPCSSPGPSSAWTGWPSSSPPSAYGPAALHGGKSQPQRTRTLAEFREGRMDVLVATNVAARGIHVDGVDLVVNVDPPNDPKDYLHRARPYRPGRRVRRVVTLVLPKQRRTTLAMLEKAGVEPTETRVRAGDPAWPS